MNSITLETTGSMPGEATPTINTPEGCITLVYVGLQIDDKNTQLHRVWMLHPNGEPIEQANRYVMQQRQSKKLSAHPVPGAMYHVKGQVTETGIQYHADTATYARQWPDKELVTRWQASSSATQVEYDRRRTAQQEANLRRDLEALKPFRQVYAAADHAKRAALLASVINYITAKGER